MDRRSTVGTMNAVIVLLTAAVFATACYAVSSAGASEPDEEEQRDVGDEEDEENEEAEDDPSHSTNDTSDVDDYPWITLPSSIDERFDLGLEEFQEDFQEHARCFEHDAGYVLCTYQSSRCTLSCHNRGFLLGTRQALYHVDTIPFQRDFNLEDSDPSEGRRTHEHGYCAFYDTPLEGEQIPPSLESSQMAPEKSPLINRDTFLKFPSRICPEENGETEPTVELFCGAVVQFSPLSSESSRDLLENAELHWPYSTPSIIGGINDDGELFVNIAMGSAAGTRRRVYYGHPPELHDVSSVEQYTYEITLPDGRVFVMRDDYFHSFRAHLREDEDSPIIALDIPGDRDGHLHPDTQLRWREIFREKITDPALPLLAPGKQPGPCRMLESGIFSP